MSSCEYFYFFLDSLKIDAISKSGWLDTHTSLSIPTPHIPTSTFNGASLSTPYVYIYIHTRINTCICIKSNAHIQRRWRRPASRIFSNQSHLVCRWFECWSSCLDVIWLQWRSWMGSEYGGFLKQYVLIWYTRCNVIRYDTILHYDIQNRNIMQHK